jgi:hypothetical protein
MKAKRLGPRQQEAAGKAFDVAVVEEARFLGCMPLDDNGLPNTFTIDTVAGPLRIVPISSELGHGGFVACRFKDVEKAREILASDARLNPFSGKWNLDLYDVEDASLVRAELRRHLNRVLVRKVPLS